MKESADLFVLLTPQEMAIADRLTIERGTPGYDLMKRAGATIFDALGIPKDAHWVGTDGRPHEIYHGARIEQLYS